ncbi:hypothetical protein C8J57DRAFT_1407193 [Mycena rebaudengoi]|nr:hypothetical protein C8J57DRAFT_1407193 [Mycena rebaudengoi]
MLESHLPPVESILHIIEAQKEWSDLSTYVAPSSLLQVAYPLDSDGAPVAPQDLLQHSKTHAFELPRCFHDLPVQISSGGQENRVVLSCDYIGSDKNCGFLIHLTNMLSNPEFMDFEKYPARIQVGHLERSIYGEDYTPVSRGFNSASTNAVGELQCEPDAEHIKTAEPELLARSASRTSDGSLPSLISFSELNRRLEPNVIFNRMNEGTASEDESLPSLRSISRSSNGSMPPLESLSSSSTDDVSEPPANILAILRGAVALRRITDTLTHRIKQFVLTSKETASSTSSAENFYMRETSRRGNKS